MKNSPQVSLLQFVVLNCLAGQELTGRQLREAMKNAGIKKSGPAFYQLMARLEDMKFVKSGEVDADVGRGLKERTYELTVPGKKVRWETEQMIEAAKPEGVSGELTAKGA